MKSKKVRSRKGAIPIYVCIVPSVPTEREQTKTNFLFSVKVAVNGNFFSPVLKRPTVFAQSSGAHQLNAASSGLVEPE